MSDYPDHREGDYSPDQQYRLYKGGWVPAAEYEQHVAGVWDTTPTPPTPWYKRKEVLAVGVIGGVLALIGVGFAAGGNNTTTPNETEKATEYEGGSQWGNDDPAPAPAPPKTTAPAYVDKIPDCLPLVDDAATLTGDGARLAGQAADGFVGNELDYSIEFYGLHLQAETLSGQMAVKCDGIPGADDITQSVALWGDSWYEISEAMDDFYFEDYSAASAHMEKANELSSEATALAERGAATADF